MNGVCDPRETHELCPGDCPGTTATTISTGGAAAVCGNGKCETGEDYLNCAADCTTVTPLFGNETNATAPTTTTTVPGFFGAITGMFGAAFQQSNMYSLVILLLVITIVLAIVRFKVLA